MITSCDFGYIFMFKLACMNISKRNQWSHLVILGTYSSHLHLFSVDPKRCLSWLHRSTKGRAVRARMKTQCRDDRVPWYHQVNQWLNAMMRLNNWSAKKVTDSYCIAHSSSCYLTFKPCGRLAEGNSEFQHETSAGINEGVSLLPTPSTDVESIGWVLRLSAQWEACPLA